MSDETQPQAEPQRNQGGAHDDTHPGRERDAAGEPGSGREPRHTGAVERARADLAEGRMWKARDRLLGYLSGSQDDEALELLGEVHHAMGDLPAAGAAWFGTTRRGQDVDDAIDAWRERHADRFDQMWRSLPRNVRDNPGNARVEALRRRAEPSGTGSAKSTGAAAEANAGIDPAVVITVILGILFVVCAVIGAITLLRWMLPG